MRPPIDFNKSSKIVAALIHGIAEVVNATTKMSDASVMKVVPDEINAEDDRDRAPFGEYGIHNLRVPVAFGGTVS
jgi:hypothetical protein